MAREAEGRPRAREAVGANERARGRERELISTILTEFSRQRVYVGKVFWEMFNVVSAGGLVWAADGVVALIRS